jgi:hypothetical protein
MCTLLADFLGKFRHGAKHFRIFVETASVEADGRLRFVGVFLRTRRVEQKAALLALAERA